MHSFIIKFLFNSLEMACHSSEPYCLIFCRKEINSPVLFMVRDFGQPKLWFRTRLFFSFSSVNTVYCMRLTLFVLEFFSRFSLFSMKPIIIEILVSQWTQLMSSFESIFSVYFFTWVLRTCIYSTRWITLHWNVYWNTHRSVCWNVALFFPLF